MFAPVLSRSSLLYASLTIVSSRFNSTLIGARRANLNGVYNIHTNFMFYPAIMQPTHARIERVVDSEEPSETSSSSAVFPPLKPIVSRNFLVTDIHLETPPTGISAASYDVPFRTSAPDRAMSAQSDFLSSFQGLTAVPDEIRDLLPEDCRNAFDKAIDNETRWHSRWGDEVDKASRGGLVVDKAIVPYSMALV